MSIEPQQLHENRPLSPHLTIYRPQITSMMSILHRMTGVALYLGLIVWLWYLFIFVGHAPKNQISAYYIIVAPIVHIVFLLWSFALFYHFYNGIRHLCWDAGSGYELKTVNCSGILVLVATVVTTFGCWLLAMKVWF